MTVYISAALLSFGISVGAGFAVIPLLKKLKAGQNILSYVKEHEYKSGTPAMGGIIFVISATAVTLALSDKTDFRLAAVICVTGASFAAVGFLDDLLKIKRRRNEGLKHYQKISFQLAVALIVSVYACTRGYTAVKLPFSGKVADAGWWMLPFYTFVFISTTNCVNLTDGLDGLAAGVSYVYFLFLAAIILIYGNGFYRTDTFVLSCFSLVGALVGFLIFNTYKAKVFMGDTGSLSIGGFLSAISIFSGNALFIPVIGITFVFTGISVIAQVIYYKRTGKRIFLMAPAHHHFQMKGASESKIAFVYKIITAAMGALCVLAALGGN
ncbi:MAG: phospho-N-acetylmuramoyl-pentapeptide-transferase [Clostridia bacterium]|nr:phospho-N-acetylmuramoyl-pentapeptide-transferase [Clostridia bacterium]